MDSQRMSSGSSAPLHEFSGSLSLGAAGWCCRWTQRLSLWLLALYFLIISVTHFRRLSRLLQCLARTIWTMLFLARISSAPCLFAKVCQVTLWMIPVCYGDMYGHLMSILHPFRRLTYMWPEEQPQALVLTAQRTYEGCLSSFPLSFLQITGRYLLCLKGGLFIFFVFLKTIPWLRLHMAKIKV